MPPIHMLSSPLMFKEGAITNANNVTSAWNSLGTLGPEHCEQHYVLLQFSVCMLMDLMELYQGHSCAFWKWTEKGREIKGSLDADKVGDDSSKNL